MTDNLETKKLWETAKMIYLSTLPSPDEKGQVERYFSMITSVSREDGKLILKTENKFTSEYLKNNYSERLKKCMELIAPNEAIELEFRYEEAVKPQPVIKPVVHNFQPVQSDNKVSTFVSTMPLKEDYTFSEFVQGSSNSWALAAAQGVVKKPGIAVHNPLFIHGGTGLGKTHLMQAIGNQLKKEKPQLSVCYLTAETWMNEYMNSLSNGQIDTFRYRYRTVDMLLIDDVQFLQKKNQFQEEFFNTFNALQQAGKQIVMTSDVAPKNLPAIEQRLISRFEGGMVQEIESPNYETRLAILKKKTMGLDVRVPDNALEFIADTIKSHVRAMEGALSKVVLYLSMPGVQQLDNNVMAHLLKNFIEKEHSIKQITIDEIQNTIAKKFSISMAQMLSAERTASLVTPRQLAMYIARKFTTSSLPEIAKKFDKTHATIIHGVKNIEKRLDVEVNLKGTFNEILSELGCSMSDKLD